MIPQQLSGFTERGTDLEYDLAHDASGLAIPAPALAEEHREAVPTATPNYDGDYSYDLVHDIPAASVAAVDRPT